MTIHHKHMMPVERGCSFWHPRAIIEDAKAACTPQDGRQLEDQASGVNFHLNSNVSFKNLVKLLAVKKQSGKSWRARNFGIQTTALGLMRAYKDVTLTVKSMFLVVSSETQKGDE